ncbi:serine/threonine-protein kinase EDR1-like [Iris pallida]|uniref:non-specific serine/threonine protein kinase n=1 Tax=Iris pallida TaxID=29817 RepID=A0AAX6IGX0_IRIPA|nr:serine/threonine-protein kinase EDR1-like [Iris pallida]
MKNILRKFHIGSNHDPDHRSTMELPTTSPSPSCGSDHRNTAAAPLASLPSPTPAAAGSEEREDYFSSEEEYQVQLAMAISVSNSEFRRGGREAGQFRGKEEGDAESLSRRYWDYNIVDYDEKVVDGFYDIYGLSISSVSHGKIPSLVDLQTSIGDLGFEVIIVNRAIDGVLVELEQVAQCMSIDIPASEVDFMVQRISELVAQHMGGPVRDAHDMLARWTEKSTELRTSQQTSLLPIGCIKIGLPRHRSLLFKVLADKVGIPCKLVKGSHYTGIDDDAVSIIKFSNGSEFLVDLMSSPGTLLPADVLNTKDVQLDCFNATVSQNLLPWAENTSGNGLLRLEPSVDQLNGGNGTCNYDYSRVLDNRSSYEKSLLLPKISNANNGRPTISIGSSSGSNANSLSSNEQLNQLASLTASSSKQKEVSESGPDNLMSITPDMVPRTEGNMDSGDLFKELNPFQAIGVGKPSAQFKAATSKNVEYPKRRENSASGPIRSSHPLVLKNRYPCNVISNTKQSNYVEGHVPRNHVGAESISTASHSSSLDRKGVSSNTELSSVSGSSCFAEGTSDNEILHTELGGFSSHDAVENSQHEFGSTYANTTASKQLTAIQSGDSNISEKRMIHEPKEHGKDINGKHKKKCIHDRFMGMNIVSEDHDSSSSETRLSKLDPMLDGVAKWEIPWEHLIIGERIGLGSYGEVYRADWNGAEVAVKKFLDQDFYGDALDEFRSEVRIMRRLRHPNVVLFMGAVTRPPNLSIVSEFLPRGSLYRILHRPNCQIDEVQRIKMALDVAKGMNCLHTSIPTIVHRDLKSPNLLVDKNWTVKVCDFGLSRLKHSTFLSSKSTAGTPEWMAPEVLRNEPSNEKCDVYSFGVILWELATLRMPWSGMNQMQVVGAVGFQGRRLDIPKEVDPLVASIIWECWQKEPSLRPSFAQLTTALKSLKRLVIPSQRELQSTLFSQEICVNTTP